MVWVVIKTPKKSEIIPPNRIGKKETSGPSGLSGGFEEHKVQLEQRMALVASTLSSSGLRAVPLGTEEVLELLYRSFNLGDLETPVRLST